MFIKRFEAPTLLQAVEQVRTELGSDAVILSTRALKTRALFPWRRRPLFEVIAARDADDEALVAGGNARPQRAAASQPELRLPLPPVQRPSGVARPSAQPMEEAPPRLGSPARVLNVLVDDVTSRSGALASVPPLAQRVATATDPTAGPELSLRRSLPRAADEGPASAPSPGTTPAAAGTNPTRSAPQGPEMSVYLEPILAELARLKEQVSSVLHAPHALVAEGGHALADGGRDTDSTLAAGTTPAVARHIQVVDDRSRRFPGIARLEELLSAKGLGEESIGRIVSRVTAESPAADLGDPDRTYMRARDALRMLIADSREWGDVHPEGPRRVAFVGPTGVGKTTTIAKLAARYSLMQNKTVSLVAADTYRVAAVSQLKMYGELLGVEVDVVHGPQEMASVVEARAGKDVILIDTAGRSQRNNQSLDALAGLMGAASPTEVHLVLSATTKGADLADIVQRFGQLGYDKLLFTKLDESNSFGEMVEVIFGCAKPLSFLTTGQSVPNDIEVAAAERVVSLLLPDISASRG